MLTSFVGFNVDRIRFCAPSSRFGGSDTWFVTSSQNIDHALAVWDWETCLDADNYQRVTGKARYFRMSDDEDIRDPVCVATSSLSAGDQKNIGSPTQLRTISDHERSLLVTSTSAGLVFVHNITHHQHATELKYTQHTAVHSSAVNDIDLQHDKLVAASAGEDGQVHIISLADLKTRSTLAPPERRSITAIKHCTADTLALAMGSVTVLWDSRTDKAVMRCESSHGSQLTHHHVTSLAVHPDQPHRLVTGASDGRVTLYDLRVNAALQSHTSHSSLVWEVKFLPQQPDALLSCGEDGQLLLWHANTPVAPVHRLLTNIMGVNSFDIHPELQYLAGSLDQEAIVFSTQLAEKM